MSYKSFLNETDSIAENDATSHHSKPRLSYIALISLAIKNSPLQMATLNEVYQYIIANFPYFQENRHKWQNTVRHNLSLNDCFVKIPRRVLGIPGKGNFWALHPHSGGMFNHGSLLRRRRRFRLKNSKIGKNSASIHHIDSKHHFELYSAQNEQTNSSLGLKSIDLNSEGLKMSYQETQDRNPVPSLQYSSPPLGCYKYCYNTLPSYQTQMSFENFCHDSFYGSITFGSQA